MRFNHLQAPVDRRTPLKALGRSIVAGSVFAWSRTARNEKGEPLRLPDADRGFEPDSPVTAITLGAGFRGNVYGDYAVEYPDELQIVGVAEPIAIRQERYAQTHDIPDDRCFVTWEHVFDQPRFADSVIIATPDDLHYGPCMKALEMGYDVLLEKPISPSEQECREILELTRETSQIVAVCHILR